VDSMNETNIELVELTGDDFKAEVALLSIEKRVYMTKLAEVENCNSDLKQENEGLYKKADEREAVILELQKKCGIVK
jgi:hypothetical protein